MARHSKADKIINEIAAQYLRSKDFKKAAAILKQSSKENQESFIKKVRREG